LAENAHAPASGEGGLRKRLGRECGFDFDERVVKGEMVRGNGGIATQNRESPALLRKGEEVAAD
jgi:hypothetical protein